MLKLMVRERGEDWDGRHCFKKKKKIQL